MDKPKLLIKSSWASGVLIQDWIFKPKVTNAPSDPSEHDIDEKRREINDVPMAPSHIDVLSNVNNI